MKFEVGKEITVQKVQHLGGCQPEIEFSNRPI